LGAVPKNSIKSYEMRYKSKVVTAVHPQGKNENSWVEEVAIELNNW